MSEGVIKSAGFELAWQAEWTYEDAADGAGGTLKVVYDDDAEDWQDRLPAYGDGVPDDVGGGIFSYMSLRKRKVDHESGGKVVVSLVYGSAWNVDYNEDAEEPVKRYSLALMVSDEVILSHKRYQALAEDEQLALKQMLSGQRYKTDEGKEEWEDDITSELGLEVVAKLKAAITAYKEPTLMWRERYRAQELDVEMGKFARIDGAVPGNPPTGGSRNYLYIGATADQDESGEYWDVTKEWQLSGINGWDPELYEAAPE